MNVTDSIIQCGPARPHFPVLIAVPHAGRDYPIEMAQKCRLPLRNLQVLEDRFADALPRLAFDQGFQGIVARAARGWIDLNRGEREFDPALVEAHGEVTAHISRKVSGGLGIIPRRIGNGGDIWRGRISADDFSARLDEVHRPYHAKLANRLSEMAARFGIAILIDLHSMPPLRDGVAGERANIIIGDLFGKSAENWVSRLAADVARTHGLSPALNAPYAGGHSVERHGCPRKAIHAIQIEVDRSLYLDAQREETGDGLPQIQRFVASLARALADEAIAQILPIAAE